MIGILGNGSWATALAKLLTENHHRIAWWMRSEAAVTHLEEQGHNEQYLSSVLFEPDQIKPTTDLNFMLTQCNVLVMCIPSAFMFDVLRRMPKDSLKGKKIISAIKGILPEQHQLLQEYLTDHFEIELKDYFAITGPCHAEEVAQERLSYLTFSGVHTDDCQYIAALFETTYLRTTTNNDLWGSQYAAVLKNIYAVGAGIAHGLGYGDNFLSVYITSCYREMHRFLSQHFLQMNEQDTTPDFHTSAYLGDLLVTCYSPHSRNRTFGALLGKGYSVAAAKAEMNMVAEGYFASLGMKTIIDQTGIDMPIMQYIYDMLWQQKSCQGTFKKIELLLC